MIINDDCLNATYTRFAKNHGVDHIIGPNPCDTCLVKPACVNINYEGLQTHKVECDEHNEYVIKFWTAIKSKRNKK